MAEIVIYTSSIGGSAVTLKTQRMQSIVQAHTKAEAKVVYIDLDGTPEMKNMIKEKAGKLGNWPLLFRGDKYIGNLEECVDLNEYEELKPLLI